MGMPRGSKWKRLAVFSDEMNADNAPVVSSVLRAHGIETEWWSRKLRNENHGLTMRPVYRTVDWLMVRRGDWPLAYVLAKECGVSL